MVWIGAAGVGLYGLCWGLVDRRFRLPARVVRVVGGLVLAVCLVGFTAGATILVERGDPVDLAQQKWEAFKTNDTTGQKQSRYLSTSGTGRYTLWRVALEDFEAHPILGVGTQNYEATYYQLRERALGFARQPHSLPLEVLSERGLVGGVLFFGFLSACLAAALWERFRNLRSEGKAQVGALMAAVTYWFVHSSAEWFWQMPAVTLIAIAYLAMLVSPWRVDAAPEPLRWPLRAGGVGVAALALLIIAPPYLADRNLARSYAVADPKPAFAAVERAQGYNPLDPRLPQREAELAVQAGKEDRAEDAYKQAIRLNPRHYAPYAFLAEFYEAVGAKKEAREYYQKAHALNPLDPELETEGQASRGCEGAEARRDSRRPQPDRAPGDARRGLKDIEHHQHGLGHQVGLNVHDMGGPIMMPGMIITIEPGAYIKSESLGIRIEDMYLVTADGNECLSAAIPKTVAEIEALVGADWKK